MLDINKIRERKEEVKQALLKRMAEKDLDLDKVLQLDDSRRELIQKADKLKAERNKYSKTKPTAEIIEKMKQIGEQIKKIDNDLKQVERELREKLGELPNIPADDVVAGGKENNKVIKTFGKQREFDFKPKDHVELATTLELIDMNERLK